MAFVNKLPKNMQSKRNRGQGTIREMFSVTLPVLLLRHDNNKRIKVEIQVIAIPDWLGIRCKDP